MSFVDLVTSTMVRRNELEARINVFINKSNDAVQSIEQLKLQAQGLVNGLNCDPSEFKTRFLNYMKQLDEYIYLITDFNLSVTNFNTEGSKESAPAGDDKLNAASSLNNTHLMDIEPVPSTSGLCVNRLSICPKTKHTRKPKDDCLIVFSSGSVSEESIPMTSTTTDCTSAAASNEEQLADDVKKMSLDSDKDLTLSNWNLPAQEVLQSDQLYEAFIINTDGSAFWVVTEEIDELNKLRLEMFNYYSTNHVTLSQGELNEMTYCAYFDEETDNWYRCFLLNINADDTVEMYLVDTGETRTISTDGIQPLLKKFSEKPPFARCCHFADLNFIDQTLEGEEKLCQFMKQFNGMHCNLEIEDNSSESLSVYVFLGPNILLNSILIEKRFAVPIPTMSLKANDELAGAAANVIDISDCPEYEDAVEAVTGYRNRDDENICKFYRGEPEKQCFKGARCKKKHIPMHPDGWTLDRVAVVGGARAAALPPPGAWAEALVTCVAHFDRVYLQLRTEPDPETPRSFGVVVPPTTLATLVRDMNSPAGRLLHRPLTLPPAPGEIVAAIYPPDDCWYRARVLSSNPAEQSIEILYVDYGTECWVREDAVRRLDAAFAPLPHQAIRCRLADAAAAGADPLLWRRARDALAALVLDELVDVQIVSRSYDEMEVILLDNSGYSITHQLAAMKLIKLVDYVIVDDTNCTKQVIVP